MGFFAGRCLAQIISSGASEIPEPFLPTRFRHLDGTHEA